MINTNVKNKHFRRKAFHNLVIKKKKRKKLNRKLIIFAQVKYVLLYQGCKKKYIYNKKMYYICFYKYSCFLCTPYNQSI